MSLRAFSLCVVAAAMAIAACTDRIMTAPDEEARPIPGPSEVTSNVTTRPANAPDGWNQTITLPASGMATTMNLGTIPYGSVLVEATGTGTITGEWTQPCTDPGACFISPVPPTGVAHPNNCYGPMVVEGAHLTGTCGGSETTGLHLLRDSVIVGRKEGTMPTRLNPDGTVLCSAPSCIQWSGTQQLAMTRVPAEASVQAFEFPSGKPATTVYFGQQVQFKVARETSVAGVAPTSIPLHMFGWTWTASGGGVVRTSLTSSCPWSGTTCTVELYESGEMAAAAYVNGAGQDPSVHVEVIKRKLKLKVAPATYVKKGTKLTWTSTTDTTIGWRSSPTWAASDSSAYTNSTCVAGTWTCTEYAQKNYIRYHTARIDDSVQTDQRAILVFTRFEVRADNSAPKLGDTVTFKAFIDDSVRQIPRWQWDQESVDAADCAGDSICVRVMTAPGVHTMKGYTAPEAGVGDSASAAVTVAEPVLTMAVSKTTAAPSELVTFRLLTDGVESAADTWQFVPDTGSLHAEACMPGHTGCEKVMRASGTMLAHRVLGGSTYSASAHVTVTGDCTGEEGSASLSSFNLVGEPCGGTSGSGGGGGGDPKPPTRILTVIRRGSVVQDPYLSYVSLPAGDDTIATFVVYADSTRRYKFSAGPGHTDLLVTVDDTLRDDADGTIEMTHDRVLTVETRPSFADNPRVLYYRDRILELFLSETKPESMRALLQALASETVTSSSAFDDFTTASQLAVESASATFVSPTAVFDSLSNLDRALRGLSFRLSAQPDGYVSVSIGRLDTVPVVALKAPEFALVTGSQPKPIIRYVNGIFNERRVVAIAGTALRTLMGTRNLWPDSVDVEWVVNPTISEQWPATRDSINHVCALRALAVPPAYSERYRRRAYTRCVGTQTGGSMGLLRLISAHDLSESFDQYLNIKFGAPSAIPGIVTGLANSMRDDIATQRHGIWVPHSQGNMAVAQAIAKLHAGGSALQQGVCTAVVSLASPIASTDFGVAPAFVLGYTTKYDILRHLLPDTDFPLIDTDVTDTIDVRLRVDGDHVTGADRQDAHGVMRNYFQDARGSAAVAEAIASLLTRCRGLE